MKNKTKQVLCKILGVLLMANALPITIGITLKSFSPFNEHPFYAFLLGGLIGWSIQLSILLFVLLFCFGYLLWIKKRW